MAAKTKAAKATILNGEPEMVLINKVKPHPRNPRTGDLEAIQRSIQEYGFYGALVVQESTGFILAGSQRWKAAKKEGIKEVSVIRVDVDDDLAMKILLVDNRSSERAEWDFQALAVVLREWTDRGEDFSAVGWEAEEIAEILQAGWDQPEGPGTEDVSGESTEKEEGADSPAEEDGQKPPQKRPGADPNKATIVMTKEQYHLLAEVRRHMTKDISEDEELEDAEVIEALCNHWLTVHESKAKKKSKSR